MSIRRWSVDDFKKYHELYQAINFFLTQKRLQKELMSMQREPSPGVSINSHTLHGNSLSQYVLEIYLYSFPAVGQEDTIITRYLCRWIIDMEGAEGTLYEGERFQLLFKFSSKYPFDSPEASYCSVRGGYRWNDASPIFPCDSVPTRGVSRIFLGEGGDAIFASFWGGPVVDNERVQHGVPWDEREFGGAWPPAPP